MKPKDCLFRGRVTDDDPRVWLYLRLGPLLFRSFQKKYGGRKIFVPKIGKVLPCAYCSSQREHIHLLREKGYNVPFIARRFGISLKHVYARLNPTFALGNENRDEK
ncbi:MAG: hypothetical protein HY610_03635 [Elusimicrobia bacterium]|nr:hypothetical protein [Elusimicrobiota bacterium]